MHRKIQPFSNFSRAVMTTAHSIRPDNEQQLLEVFTANQNKPLLARGNGLSYSDCCLFHEGTIINTSRLNHILSFDESTGIAVCQGAVTFADLFLLHPAFIPPVLPGTLYATLAGGIANDVHGKNNHQAGSLGHHIDWLELQIGTQTLRCSLTENEALYKATIAGLGLTGIIKRLAIRLRKAPPLVEKKTEKFTCLASLLQYMQHEGIQHDYQVAWLDLLNEPRAILSWANHVTPSDENTINAQPKQTHTIPKLPIRLITPWLVKQFNRAYYHQASTNAEILPLWRFNNPLDEINHWNYLYGKKGLLQFQAVFEATNADTVLHSLFALARSHQATPMLTVLKYFTKEGHGLLSFPKPGFTLAIDFVNNQPAREAIDAMNELIARSQGKIYLAKDLRLNREQFRIMYPQHEVFCDVLAKHNSPMQSDLGKRLGLNR